jgi:ankyrin repeat protein
LKSVGVNLTEIDENGNNIIHGMFLTLTEYGKFSIDMEALKFAIKEGANVNQINKAGETPLFKAINSRLKNAEEVIKVLVEHGADVSRMKNEFFPKNASANLAGEISKIPEFTS